MQRELESLIISLRGHRVILDMDLVVIYGVTPKRLNEQVMRNKGRFPDDFMFQLDDQEVSDLWSQIATTKWARTTDWINDDGNYAKSFTFSCLAANVLNSSIAIESSILIVRAFMRLREMLLEHSDLKKRLQEIETRLAKGFAAHEQELQEVRFLIAQLEQPLDIKKKRIGFWFHDSISLDELEEWGLSVR